MFWKCNRAMYTTLFACEETPGRFLKPTLFFEDILMSNFLYLNSMPFVFAVLYLMWSQCHSLYCAAVNKHHLFINVIQSNLCVFQGQITYFMGKSPIWLSSLLKNSNLNAIHKK